MALAKVTSLKKPAPGFTLAARGRKYLKSSSFLFVLRGILFPMKYNSRTFQILLDARSQEKGVAAEDNLSGLRIGKPGGNYKLRNWR